MRIGLTYDLKDDYVAMGFDPEDAAEFDRPDTVEAIKSAVEKMGMEADRIGALPALMARLVAGDRWDLVFNIAEGVYGYGREAQVPALLDAYGIPYVFSDPMVLSLTLHKGMTKRVIRDLGIPTPDFAVVETREDARKVTLAGPLFIKPVAEGTSKGVTARSLVKDRALLEEECAALLERFKQPVLVETYLPGREVTVGIVGTGDAAEVVGVMEVLQEPEAEQAGYSYSNKQNWENLVKYRLATDAFGVMAGQVALAAWRGLGCRDGGRVDLRGDVNGIPSFIEVNPLAGLNPLISDLPILCRLGGMEYPELVRRMVVSALERTPPLTTLKASCVPPKGGLNPSTAEASTVLELGSPLGGAAQASEATKVPDVGGSHKEKLPPRPRTGGDMAVVVFGEVPDDAPEDEKDVLVEAEVVMEALGKMGFDPVAVPCGVELKAVRRRLAELSPVLAFNLVESLEGRGRYVHFIPSLLDSMDIPYTGAPAEAIYMTSNKLLAKKVMRGEGIPTPAWATFEDIVAETVSFAPPYIVKSIWEHASVGMDSLSVVRERRLLEMRLRERQSALRDSGFAEAFIDGREFNLSVLASPSGPQVLPPAEIRFIGYEDGSPKIVDYKAKWDEESKEYTSTVRSFDFPSEDALLLEKLKKLAGDCWRAFGLMGYARVDFRVDPAGNPFVLEVNANPCISPDAGFQAAARQAGLSFEQVMERVVGNALARTSVRAAARSGNR